MQQRFSQKSGFTLVELSIVLVIIGLLLGGILIGKDMMRAAQLRSVAVDAQQYLMSAQLFQDKYQCLPGDCLNAATYLSGVTNGNGDGILNNAAAASGVGEIFSAWQELSQAGYIKGSYSNRAGPAGVNDSLIGTNVPPSKLTGAGFSWINIGYQSAAATYYDGNYGNGILFGATQTGSFTNTAILTPAEAMQIDQKIDDGMPGLGNVRTRIGSTATNCGTTTSGSTSVYNTPAYTGVACQLIFISGW